MSLKTRQHLPTRRSRIHEIGLQAQHLREHLDDRRKFFDNKDRLAKLKTLVAPDDTAADLGRKMLAVVVRADQTELFNIIRALFHLFTDADEIDLRHPPQAWQQIEKFDLDKPFWQMVKTFLLSAESRDPISTISNSRHPMLKVLHRLPVPARVCCIGLS